MDIQCKINASVMAYMYSYYLFVPCVPVLTPLRRLVQIFAEPGCSILQTSYQDHSKVEKNKPAVFFGNFIILLTSIFQPHSVGMPAHTSSWQPPHRLGQTETHTAPAHVGEREEPDGGKRKKEERSRSSATDTRRQY